VRGSGNSGGIADGGPIRVAHVIGKVIKGGVESVVFNYYRAIDRERVQFDFIIDEDSPNEIPDDVRKLGCRIYKIPSYRHLPAYMKSLERIFAEGQYRIAHSHMNTLSVFALCAAKRAGVPVRIAHSHSTAGKGEFARNIMKYALRPFSRVCPTHLFACSEYAGRWLFGDRAFEKGEVTVIRNAIDTSKFRFNAQARERVRRELGVGDKLVIGHVGRFMPQKNHTFLLDIFAEVHRRKPDSVLLLIGDGELRQSMEEKAKRLGLEGSIMFLGARDDVHELYQAMDVFVLPSLYEGLGIVGVEAQCAGLPCVFSSMVPNEAVTSLQVVIYPLECPPEKWVNAIIRKYEIEKRDSHGKICREKWSVCREIDKLSEQYRLLDSAAKIGITICLL
jgi:glycosyltransferase EpsF